MAERVIGLLTELFMEKEKRYEDDYREFVALLNKRSVEYLIVGAYASIYHTKIPRTTKDIDFWIRKTDRNAENCAKAIKDFCGANIKKEDLLEDKKIIFIGREPYRIDIFNEQADLAFEDAWQRRENDKFRDLTVHFVSRKDLVRIKKYFSRSKDIEDVDSLMKSDPVNTQKNELFQKKKSGKRCSKKVKNV